MIVTCVRCNDCGVSITVDCETHLTRARLKQAGWQVGLPGGKDRCSSCVKVLKFEKEAIGGKAHSR